MKFLFRLLLLLLPVTSFSQKRSTTIKGVIISETNQLLVGASVNILGNKKTVISTDSGKFLINVPFGQSFALIFSYAGYSPVQKNLFLYEGETQQLLVRLKVGNNTLETVEITADKSRLEPSVVSIDPTKSISIPSATGGVEALIKTIVGSNNELSSQYSVRGGNYDENLIYINDFEIFRPYLVSSGQQEGLSLINPDLTKNVTFYTGAFSSIYGDKMSSVLDIQYKNPTYSKKSVYVSLLQQGLHAEGKLKKHPVTYAFGLRNKNNRNVLSNQPTLGSYIPSAADAQGYITYKIAPKWQLELLGIYSVSSFSYFPESVQKTSSVFSPLFSAAIGLDVNFEGQEIDRYKSTLAGATAIFKPSKKTTIKFLASYFQNQEEENFDIAGAYLFGERDFDRGSASFGQITNALGAGYYQNYGRNKLNIKNWNGSIKGSTQAGKHYIQYGSSIDKTIINDKLSQFEYQDSAGYSLPYSVSALTLFNVQQSDAQLDINKFSGYIQDNMKLRAGNNAIYFQGGLRYNYNSLNKEFLISPRAQASWKPIWKNDIVFKLAAGVYQQPPFYRELRDNSGNLNTNILAQKSVQFVAGADYKFLTKNNSPVRITSELYYKKMTDVVPYDIDNVKIRYFGGNDTKAYTVGADFRLYGELTKDAQSWVSIGIMRSREDLANDFFFKYKNASGEEITSTTQDQIVTDSVKTEVGHVRRPSDRLLTMGVYVEDYLATNKNFKIYINLIYGSNMSYNIPGSTRFRNGLIIEPYIRADIGLSALLLNEQQARRSHSLFKGFDNIWASLEVLNLIDRANTISYQLIKDFSNSTYAIPNRLTPRLLNFKILARF